MRRRDAVGTSRRLEGAPAGDEEAEMGAYRAVYRLHVDLLRVASASCRA